MIPEGTELQRFRYIISTYVGVHAMNSVLAVTSPLVFLSGYLQSVVSFIPDFKAARLLKLCQRDMTRHSPILTMPHIAFLCLIELL